MKIIYEEQSIRALETLLNQLRVTGYEQAKILVMAGEIVHQGKVDKQPEQETEKKEGADGSREHC